MQHVKLLLLTLLLIITSCSKDSENPTFALEAADTYNMDFPEPSGLAMSYDGEHLWSVSDDNSRIYYTNLEGKTKVSFNIDCIDLEGITVIDSARIAVLGERNREIIILNVNGREEDRMQLDLRGEFNSGPEGITYNPHNQNFYILNEKNPGMLIVVDRDLNEQQRIILTFASDYSGICYHNMHLWIISDEESTIYKCTLMGTVVAEIKVDLPQIEGITVDEENKKIYIVSDSAEKLYVYNL